MVELFPFGPRSHPEIGELRVYESDSDALTAAAASEAEAVVVFHAPLLAEARRLAEAAAETDDLAHAGLLLGGAGAFGLSKLACLNWFLLDPDGNSACTSWRATPSLCLFRPPALRRLGGFDTAYNSPAAKLMDFAYRLLAAGGRVKHHPVAAIQPGSAPPAPIPLEDEFVFLLRHIGSWHARWAALWAPLAGRDPLSAWLAASRALRRVKRSPAPQAESVSVESRLLAKEPRQKVTSITAIVPTLNRYEYVPRSIQSLLNQQPPPDEILVVDQRSLDRRDPAVYAPFEGPGFRVIYQDRAGQSTSRNEAIRQATGEWCLLWEDDTEAWDDLMKEHVRAVEYSGADASTGVSLAPWKNEEHIPVRKRHHQLSDVFATGNCLVRRQALLDVGGLDVAFNRGSGADHDLGVRLYLQGKEIIFNPRAIETHHKAPSGGMRTYGAWWRNRTTWLSPYPPPTQIYTVRRYYPRAFRLPLYLLHFWTAAKQHRMIELVWLWLAAPWKLWRATRAAGKLQTELGL